MAKGAGVVSEAGGAGASSGANCFAAGTGSALADCVASADAAGPRGFGEDSGAERASASGMDSPYVARCGSKRSMAGVS